MKCEVQWIKIPKDGLTIQTPILKTRKGTWIHFEGDTFYLEDAKKINSKSGDRSKASSVASNEIRSPMPGKMMKIVKNKDEAVSVGEIVVIMEAMKMEYSLKSQMNGKIKKVFVVAGSQVELDQILVEIEPI